MEGAEQIVAFLDLLSLSRWAQMDRSEIMAPGEAKRQQ